MNRKIALSALSIVAALALMGGSAFAAVFDTSANATANAYASGNPHLQISSDGTSGSFQDSIITPPGLSATGIIPNHPGNGTFYLENTGDQPLNVVTYFAPTGTGDALGTATGHLEHDLQVGITCVDKTTSASIGSISPESFSSYEPTTGLSLGTLAVSQVAKCTVATSVTAPFTAKGQTLNYDATFGGNE